MRAFASPSDVTPLPTTMASSSTYPGRVFERATPDATLIQPPPVLGAPPTIPRGFDGDKKKPDMVYQLIDPIHSPCPASASGEHILRSHYTLLTLCLAGWTFPGLCTRKVLVCKACGMNFGPVQ